MKILTFLTFLLLSTRLHATVLEIYTPCSDRPNLSFEVNASKYESVGDLTVAVFSKNKIPFQGTERGINQIFNSPLGLDALEVISDTKMFAYGWCYEVDGLISSSYASEYILTGNESVIKWFFGTSEFEVTEWLNFCIPSHLRSNSNFCKQIK